MAQTKVLFDDLWTYGTGSIAHVRVVKAESGTVALVREPLDNPAGSAYDRHQELCGDLEISYGPVRLLIALAGAEQSWTDPVQLDEDGLMSDLPPGAARALVGDHADHPTGQTCRELGGDGHPLLAFVHEEAPASSALRVVALSSLPWPHNPSRCRAHERFEALALSYPPGAAETGVVGAHWTATLTDAEVHRCLELGGDWKQAAATAVSIVRDGVSQEREVVEQAIREAGLTGKTAAACLTLFTQPITWSVGHQQLTNGQHRSCALRAAGALECVADLYGAEPPAGEPMPVGRAAAASIARYWRHRAAG